MAKNKTLSMEQVRAYTAANMLEMNGKKKAGPLTIAEACCGLAAEDPIAPHLMCFARNPDYKPADLELLWLSRKELILMRHARGIQFITPTEQAVALHCATSDQFLKTSAFDLYHKYKVLSHAKKDDPSYGDSAQYDVEAPALQEVQMKLMTLLSDKPMRKAEIEKRLNVPYTVVPLLRHVVDERLVAQTNPKRWDNDDYEYMRMDNFLPGLNWEAKSLKSVRNDALIWYLQNCGPACATDIIHWSGWSKTVVASLIKNMEKELDHIVVDGEEEPFYTLKGGAKAIAKVSAPLSSKVYLLPADDSYTANWGVVKRVISPERQSDVYNKFMRPCNTIVYEGLIIGVWAFDAKKTKINLTFFETPAARVKKDAESEANAIIKFLKIKK